MLSFIIFIISGFIISYVTIFFMELSLARLADGGKFWQSFNLRSIKHTIDVIGWKRYTIAYTKIILVIVIFTFANNFSDPYFGWNIVIGILSQFIIFIVEYRGVGNIYKLYVNNKEKIDGLNS